MPTEVDSPSTSNGGVKPDRPPVPVFQPASALLKAGDAGSLRNASGGQPPIPRSDASPVHGANGANGNGSIGRDAGKPPEAGSNAVGQHSTNTEESGVNGNAAAGPSKIKPINRPAGSKNSIVYSAVQRRNPVLSHVKNIGTEIGDIVADYQVGTHNGVLFLSLKYHRLHPEYIHQRIERMKNMYNARILLVHSDINEPQQSIRELSKIAIINQLTMIVAWSAEEAGQYLTTLKAYEHKSDDTLKEKVHQEYHEQLQHVLTSGKKVNKTDADNLASQFGSFSNIARQPSKLLSNVKGLGATKVTSLLDAFNKPFLVGGLKRDFTQKDRPGAAEADAMTFARSRAGNGGTNSTVLGKRPAEGAEEAEQQDEEVGSPDWPDSPPSTRNVDGERGRDRAPSRSPGLSPELQAVDDEADAPQAEVWRDPLDEDEDDAPTAKRARTET